MPGSHVSGDLPADAGGQAHAAAHARAELHIAGPGWLGFASANRCCPDGRCVRLWIVRVTPMSARPAAPGQRQSASISSAPSPALA